MTIDTLTRAATAPDLAATMADDRPPRPRGGSRTGAGLTGCQGGGVARRRRRGAGRRRTKSSPPMPMTSTPRNRPASARRCSTGWRSTRSGSTAVARGLEDIAALPDPIGHVLDERARPNGLRISRVAVPLGVIGIIYESRPNVTADAGGLAVKSGNAAILRGGSESFHSSRALVAALRAGAARGRVAGRCDPAGADPRPRRGRHDADDERRHRHHRPTRGAPR